MQASREILSLGRILPLEISRFTPQGAYLKLEEEQEVLLPTRYLTPEMEVSSRVEVFLYHDNEGRLIATTERPLILLGETKLLRCRQCTAAGAFLEWGIMRDLFAPHSEQLDPMEEGYSYVVHLYIDQRSGRLTASSKLAKHIGNLPPNYRPGSKVEGIVVDRNEHGYRLVVDGLYWGMLYHGDLEQELDYGDQLEAYVVRTRDDGKLDLSPSQVGYRRRDEASEKLLALLRQHGGKLPIGDKSSPEEVLALTGMSKKLFKLTIGKLYRERLLELEDKAIRLKKGRLS